jgi:hypothetical protein
MEKLRKQVDNLAKQEDLKSTVKSLTKILHRLLYYISQSEGAVLDYREKWHDDYTAALNEAVGKSRGNSQGSSSTTTGKKEKKKDSPKARARRTEKEKTVSGKEYEKHEKHQERIPASLKKFLD